MRLWLKAFVYIALFTHGFIRLVCNAKQIFIYVFTYRLISLQLWTLPLLIMNRFSWKEKREYVFLESNFLRGIVLDTIYSVPAMPFQSHVRAIGIRKQYPRVSTMTALFLPIAKNLLWYNGRYFDHAYW